MPPLGAPVTNMHMLPEFSPPVRAVALLGGDGVLPIVPVTAMEVHDMLRRKLPMKAAASLVRNLDIIPIKERVALELALGHPHAAERAVEQAAQPVLRLQGVGIRYGSAKIEAILGSIDRAERWFLSPAIVARRPIDLMTTSQGISIVYSHIELLAMPA
jgi:hypothetical protein